jgi:hypothetical protein
MLIFCFFLIAEIRILTGKFSPKNIRPQNFVIYHIDTLMIGLNITTLFCRVISVIFLFLLNKNLHSIDDTLQQQLTAKLLKKSMATGSYENRENKTNVENIGQEETQQSQQKTRNNTFTNSNTRTTTRHHISHNSCDLSISMKYGSYKEIDKENFLQANLIDDFEHAKNQACSMKVQNFSPDLYFQRVVSDDEV